jgi:hypothetical protein
VLSSWFSGCCSRACSHLADRPCGGCGPSAWRVLPRCSSRSSRVLERYRFDLVVQWLLVESGLADSPQGRRGQSARHELLADHPRTWYGPSARGGAGWVVLLVINGPSAMWRGPSAWWSRNVRPGPRTVRLGCCRTAKSFASWFVLPLWDRLGFVPRIGTSVVTT